jgi:phosphoribosylglycinamide formyltransferase 1
LIRVAILISGGGSNMLALVNSMVGDHPARASLVISNIAEAGGLAKAQALGVQTMTIAHKDFEDRAAFEAALHQALVHAKADLICLAGFMRILTPAFFQNWAGKIMNIHPSLLPKYPGLHTHHRALEAGDAEAGCTVHLVTADLDAGPILGQAMVQVQEHLLYPLVLRRVAEGNLTPLYLS